MADAARLRRARNRNLTGRTLLEGPNLVAAALAAGADLETVFTLEDMDIPEAVVVTPEVLAKISDTKSPQGPIAVMAIPESQVISGEDVVVLAELSDPGNAGTVIRSAAAFGFGVIILRGADPWSPKVLRSGAGAHFLTKIERTDALTPPDLTRRGFFCVGSVVTGGTDSLETTGFVSSSDISRPPLALWIGSEAHGLDRASLDAMDALVTIDMHGDTESLNAAVAASILMFAWRTKENEARR